MPTRVLSLHADYACQRTGRCCTAGWPIAVEPPVERVLRDALAAGRLRPGAGRPEPFAREDDPPGLPAVLALDGRGRCVFFEEGAPNACAIQRALGHERLPMACRQFPRMAVLTPLGASVTLSHYCPTVGAALFRDDRPLQIVEDPPAFPPGGEYEGLDARAGLSLLRPGVFLDWESHRRWEAHAVAVLAREDLSPESALARLRADAETARAWAPDRGPLRDWIAAVASNPGRGEDGEPPGSFGDALAAWRLAVSCVPAGTAAPRDVREESLAAADGRHVRPAWPGLGRPIRRYLAAKAFASWCAVQGDGLRTAVAFLAAALSALRVEAARVCEAAGRRLDPTLLKDAAAAADLLLVHLVSPAALARRLSACEPPP